MFNTDGLVIKSNKYGESYRIIYVLTPEKGIITASSRISGKINSESSSGTQLFSYSSFSFNKRKDRYYVSSAKSLHIFYELRKNLEKLSLAEYFSELLLECRNDRKNEEIFRLSLNTLYFLEKGTRQSPELLKSVFELRLLSLNGFTPDVLACRACGKYIPENPVFLIRGGCFYCAEHLPPENERQGDRLFLISKNTLHAIRYIVLSDLNKIFSFRVSLETEKELGKFSEEFARWQLSRKFPALEFYKSIKSR